MNNSTSKSLVIIRFSSFGDIVQCLSAAQELHSTGYKLTFVTKTEFQDIPKHLSFIGHVLAYNKKTDSLFKLSQDIIKTKPHKIYDAHNNTRSLILKFMICFQRPHYVFKFITRPKNRIKRMLLFKFKMNFFDNPFVGAKSYKEPLLKHKLIPANKTNKQITPNFEWNESNNSTEQFKQIQKSLQIDYLCLAPSAAWDLKKWPLDHWKGLINKLQSDDRYKNIKLVLLGGPQDTEPSELKKNFPDIINLSGTLSYLESILILQKAEFFIGGDTGLAHIADQAGVPNLMLIGSSAFGFPERQNSKYLSLNLKCQPCSKDGSGKCQNSEYLKCLKNLSPESVLRKIHQHHAPETSI